MKRIIGVLFIAVCLFVFAGCQESAKKAESGTKRSVPKTKIDGRIVVPAGEKFPGFLAGTWKADENIWQIEIGKNGKIVSVVYVMWNQKINLSDGYYYTDGPDKDTYAYFVLGPCSGSYDPASRKLKIDLNMGEYELWIPDGSLRGRSEDHLEGIVSQDGKRWDVDWRGYGYLDGAQLPDVNSINANPKKLIFRKIDGK